MNKFLEATKLLDYQHPSLQNLIQEKGWTQLVDSEKVRQIYNFVRDEILFGYNMADDIPASQILKEGYGQCNTKSTLLMALLRAVRIPCRIHGFTINKQLQKGAVTGIWYRLSPSNILHSWVEVGLGGAWYFLEGVILDKPYLSALQRKFSHCKTTFCGYGAYTENFANPVIDWNSNHTFIQDKGINQDFGVFDSPDAFYAHHQQRMGFLKRWIFRNYVRHLMNRNVREIRNGYGQKLKET